LALALSSCVTSNPMPPIPKILPPQKQQTLPTTEGVPLCPRYLWTPHTLPNAHTIIIGASGSGKTQTLKGLLFELNHWRPDLTLLVIDFHGDQKLPGERTFPLHLSSQWGINPLEINLDPTAGGPNIQAITIAAELRKALRLGPNQEGVLLRTLKQLYDAHGLNKDWKATPPTFHDLEQALIAQEAAGCKESAKILLKLQITFEFRIFSRQSIPITTGINRVDLSSLPQEIAVIAANALIAQQMNRHRIAGESPLKTFIAVDEAKKLPQSSACDLVMREGRKYGIHLMLASQSDRHLSEDVLANSSTKIVLPVDPSEVNRVAKTFRFDPNRLAKLKQFEALVRMGTSAFQTRITPFFERINPQPLLPKIDHCTSQRNIEQLMRSPQYLEVLKNLKELRA